ncbi:MAG: endo-1,4-beta-xylanase [Planctomycetes bacterium]|nr:endo-1,4-beta-xylanase [Planctomycetota bacterium]MBU4397693.1 endo-1,4-beta-xylanase [Planctomycetota bacterium]MCG2683343.1 endo-1,4-beta-xylanase [Planctomycetales bacterium]
MMRFRVFPAERNTEQLARQAYLAGIDRTSWPVRTAVEGDTLVLHRSVSDSANLHAPWPVEGHGELTLSTGSLIERTEPYLLPLELVRGTIVQVRNQLSEWQLIGLAVPKAVGGKLATAIERFSHAAVEQNNPAVSARYSDESLRAALEAANLLAAAYTEQVFAARRREKVSGTVCAEHPKGRAGKRCPTPFPLLGAELGADLLDDHTSRQFLMTFNAAEVPICWRETESTEGRFSWTTNDRQIQWCRKHGLKVVAGPLLLLDHRDLPDWLYLFEDDFENVLEFVSTLVRATVNRYRGQVDYWICAGRVNSDVLAMSEQERLRLVARTVELTRELDPDTPALVSFDQPWAEYMRERHVDFPPFHFADTLIRADIGLSGLMMEMNLGYFPGGTMPRHILEFNRQLDAWSLLGLPLWLSLCAPSAYHDDPLAVRKVALRPGSWTPAAQQSFAARLIPFALARQSIQGVLWNQLHDSRPHDFPHGGLFDDRRQAKPALRTLAAIRRKYLKSVRE